MGHTYAVKKGIRYCYYVCQQAQKRGWSSCPSRSVPADPVERVVLDQVQGKLPALAALWPGLAASARNRLLPRLIERINYDGGAQTLKIAIRAGASQTLLEHDEENPS